MSGLRDLFRRAAALTEPEPGAVDRLVRRQTWPGEALRAAHEPEAAPGAEERLIVRLRSPRPRPGRAWLLAPVAVAAAVALLWPSPPPPVPLAERLDSERVAERAVTERVHLSFVGHGELSGTDRDVHILWSVGTLEVEVEPGAGVSLVVETSEGRVSVVGTRFSVNRGPLGTVVEVDRGHVRVSCGARPAEDLVDQGQALCVPTRPAGLLGRARALRAQGEPEDEVLAAVAQGLAIASPGDPAIGELVALRLDVLISSGRYAEAREAAEAYLRAGDSSRRDEVESILRALSGK